MANGLFITFEGGEGCGKTTQVKRVATRLKNAGRNAFLVREPGGTLLGEELRRLLQFTPELAGMCAETELLLYAASRAQLVAQIILPALDQGAVVLCDRYLDSTTVYQGIARGLPLDAVRAVNKFATRGHLPDLTLLFDLDPAEARRRLLRRPRPASGIEDRMEIQPPEFYVKVREGYLQVASAETERFVVIDASGSADEIERIVWKTLRARFPSLG